MMDMHCHVDLYPDHDKILEDMERAGYYVLSVTTVPSAYEGTVHFTRNIKNCRTALGLHPQLAHERYNELPLFDKLVSKTRYIGEIGLDGSGGYKAHLDIQRKVFHHILQKCSEFPDKILTIHSLNAVNDILESLEHFPHSGRPILHWFLGTKTQLTHALSLGGFFSVGPAMIQSSRGQKVISWIPKDRILLETDGPFAKIYKREAYPSDVGVVINYLVELWQVDEVFVKLQLRSNLKSALS